MMFYDFFQKMRIQVGFLLFAFVAVISAAPVENNIAQAQGNNQLAVVCMCSSMSHFKLQNQVLSLSLHLFEQLSFIHGYNFMCFLHKG